MKPVIAALVGCSAVCLLSACNKTDNAGTGYSQPSATTPQATTPQADPGSSIVATVTLSPASDSKVRGTVNFIREKDSIRVEANLTGLTQGQHGFHIHEKGDCTAADASSAGGHFNPGGMPHGGPLGPQRHVGDLGNIEADASGNARYSQSFSDLKLDGDTSIIGRSVIVHAKADDYKSQPSGDAGGRIACGVIERK